MKANDSTATPVLEMRVAVTTDDYDRLVDFYCKALGLQPAAIWKNDGGRAMMLELGRATLEIFDERQAQVVDELEVGRRVSGKIRFALQVPDLNDALTRLAEHDVTIVHPPVVTPWGDYNARVTDSDGMQITLFQAAGVSE